MYRVNYGNGQVQEGFKTVKAARAHIASLDAYQGFAFVERKEAGEWFNAVNAAVGRGLWRRNMGCNA